jgi:hypothetical protein
MFPNVLMKNYENFLPPLLVLICDGGGGVEGNAYTVHEWEWKIVRVNLPFNVNSVTTIRLKTMGLPHKTEREACRMRHICSCRSQL